MSFKRHTRPECIHKKRATFDSSTFLTFQSVEVSLRRLLSSSARVCFTQPFKFNLTQFIEQTQKIRSGACQELYVKEQAANLFH